MSKFIWLGIAALNALVMAVAITRGEWRFDMVQLTLLPLYVAIKEWETEALRKKVGALTSALWMTLDWPRRGGAA